MKLKLTLKTTMFAGLTLFSMCALMMQPSRVTAQNFERVCTGVSYTGDGCDQPGNAEAQASINELIHTGLDLFSAIVGIVGVVMIIFGGFKYVTAGGDSSRINSAQQTIIYALVGLVVAAMAQAIAWFIAREINT